MQKQYLMVGYPFSGKTTLAKEIAQRLNLVRVNIDEVKEELGFKNITDDQVPNEAWNQIFALFDNRIEKALRAGQTIVNEYAWVSREWRNRARKIADRCGVETIVIFVDIPAETVRRRWLENRNNPIRFDVSDTDFNEAVANFEKPTEDENVVRYSGEDIDTWIKQLHKLSMMAAPMRR